MLTSLTSFINILFLYINLSTKTDPKKRPVGFLASKNLTPKLIEHEPNLILNLFENP